MKRYLVFVILCVASATCLATPHHRAARTGDNALALCVRDPINTAPVMLKNAGFLSSLQDIDESKTKATRLSANKVGKDLYVQVYDIIFHLKSGKAIQVVTRSNVSNEECTAGHIDVYVVSRKILDTDPPP
jgi:hypothetical protein